MGGQDTPAGSGYKNRFFHLKTELKIAKSIEIKAIVAKYKFGLVLIGIALLQYDGLDQKNSESKDEDIFETIFKITKALSPIIIPMIDSLGAIELEDIISMPEEQL